MKCLVIVAAIACLALFVEVQGHGMMLNPPGRSSRWREDSSAPANYDDNGLYCGGYNVQHQTYGGRCGICGDSFGDAQPRANELGGHYGQGVITRTYNSHLASIDWKITTNHIGHVHLDLCNLAHNGNRESEECFQRILFADGSDRMSIGTTTGMMHATIQLPNTSCHHCVLRWTYTASNNWGYCPDGSGALGCGPQETFKSCADISIFNGYRSILETPAVNVVEVPEVPVEIEIEQ